MKNNKIKSKQPLEAAEDENTRKSNTLYPQTLRSEQCSAEDNSAHSQPVPAGVDDNEFSISDMYDPRSKYTYEEKIAAVQAFHQTGTSKQAAALMKKWGTPIPAATIRWWKTQSAWWPTAIEYCQRETNDKLDAAMTRILDLALGGIERALIEGEEVIAKNGQVVRKELSTRDKVGAYALLFDKLQVLRGKPTSISRRDTTDVMSDLVSKFEELSEEIRSKKDPRVIN